MPPVARFSKRTSFSADYTNLEEEGQLIDLVLHTSGRLSRLDPLCRPNPIIDILSNPFPQLLLSRRIDPSLRLPAPPLHHLPFNRPQPDPLPGNIFPPMVPDPGTGIGQADRQISGKVLQRCQIEFSVEFLGPFLDAGSNIRYSIADDHQCNRRQNQVSLFRNPGHLLKERVEIGQLVARRKPGAKIGLDLSDLFSLKIMNRMEGLRLTIALSSDGADEKLARLREPPQLIQMPIEVVRQKGQRVIVIARMVKRAADINPDKDGLPRFPLRQLELAPGEYEGKGRHPDPDP